MLQYLKAGSRLFTLFDGSVRIQKLNGVRRLLKKLSFIFDLPARLNRAIELDACTEAVGRMSRVGCVWVGRGVVVVGEIERDGD